MNNLQNLIKTKKAKVAIIGQGYVGLPLALAIIKAGFNVWGVDKDERKINGLNAGKSHIDDIKNSEIAVALKSGLFHPTTAFDQLAKSEVIIIAVPTPLDEYKNPDLSFITSATSEIAKHLRSGQLIILESTTYPGTTEEIVLPILMNSGAKSARQMNVGQDFFVAFSPERVGPGNQDYNTVTTPKVIGGLTPECTKMATLFYGQIIDHPVPVSTAKAAEMTKLLENIFRIVNISLINELAMLCNKMDIDIWEVIKAASTKPYGFMPFYPGPGIGGHCIAVDPFYLSYKAKQFNFFTRFIDLAGEINEMMPHHVVTLVTTALNYAQAKSINQSKILILGVSYKKDIKDTRESAAIKVIEMLHHKGAKLSYFDPYIPELVIPRSAELPAPIKIPRVNKLTSQAMQNQDLILILTNHSTVDYDTVAQKAKVVVDTRNAILNRAYKNVYRI